MERQWKDVPRLKAKETLYTDMVMIRADPPNLHKGEEPDTGKLHHTVQSYLFSFIAKKIRKMIETFKKMCTCTI